MTDTYVQSGDSIEIAPEDFTLVLDPATCIATNSRPVRFRVAGGTGAFAGAWFCWRGWRDLELGDYSDQEVCLSGE